MSDDISPDDASLLAMAASRMSTGSIAATMGRPWTEAKVYNRLAKLRAHGVVREAAPVVERPPPVPKASPPPRPETPMAAAAPQPAPAAVVGKPSAPRSLGPSPYDTAHPRPPPARPRQARPRPAIERLKPMTEAIRRWAGWFLDAGWAPDVVADLFGVDAGELGA